MTARLTGLLLCLVWSTFAAPARSAEPATTLAADIGPRPVAEALAAFGRQTGLQLIYVASIADAQQSKGARAGQSLSEALTQILDDTGLRFEFLNPRTVRIYAPPPERQTVSQVAVASERQTSRHGAAPALALAEVIVTATRREEWADKVPISMAVWTQEAMEASGVKSMTEIGALTPGVELDFDSITGSADYTNLVIRGVTARHGTTTGVYIDDSPVPAARGDTFARSFPWVFDLDRVEVLRGPQSTLLGQGTLGGAVRFIMSQPSLTSFSGRVRAELSITMRGDPSYEAGAAVGGPLITDVLGFRASAWYRSDGGFVDRIDPFTNVPVERNANRLLSKSARVALTWAPTGALRITPSLDYESFGIRDTPVFYVSLSSPAAGELRNGMLTQQPYNDSFYLAAVQLSEGFGGADLSAVSSYFHRTAAVTIDWGPDYPASYADAATLPVDFRQRMFSQEIRLTSADPNAVLTWIAGGFYSAEHKSEASRIVAAMGAVENANATVSDHAQLEGFGQIGLRMTKRLIANAGVRIGRTSYGAVTEAPPVIRADAAETWVAPRYVLSYRPDEYNLLYLTVAKGYRGGVVYPATPCSGLAVAPSDSVWSYEIGAKDDLSGGRVHIEPSVFHIEWSNHQADAFFLGDCSAPGVPGSAAASNGFDLAVQALVTERVKAGLAVAYTDAHYTETLGLGDAVIVHEGDALGTPPLVPSPWSVTASLEYKVRLASGVIASLWAEDNFHSHNPGPFISDNPASPFYEPGWRADPSTRVLNLRAGASWPSLDLNLFVNNALDARPFLGFRAKSPPGSLFVATTFRPRTVGLFATWRF